MRSLYEMKGEWLDLLRLLEEGEDEEFVRDTLEGLDYEIEIKAENYAKIIRQLENDIDGLDKEISRMSERKQILKNRVSYLKGNLQDAMELTGKTKFKTNLFSFNIQSNPASVVIDDPTSIPHQFLIPQEPKVDKKSIKEYLKDNEANWCHVEITKGLRIR